MTTGKDKTDIQHDSNWQASVELLNRVKSAIDGNVSQGTVDLARSRQTIEILDSPHHLAWAVMLEELGLFADVVQELNLAVRDDPANRDTYRRLADLHLDGGNPLKAARYLWALAKQEPQNQAHYRDIGKILEEAGEYKKARQVYRQGLKLTNDPIFEQLSGSLDFLDQEKTAIPDSEQSLEKGGQIVPAKHHLVTYLSLFSGREGVYARQWVSNTGETGYTPVHEPLTMNVAKNHILGNLTTGVYPIRQDNTVNFIAFDFDLAKFMLKKAISRESLWEKAINKVYSVATRLIDTAAADEIPIFLEESGFKGFHGWIFLETPIPAGVAKKFGETLLNMILPLPPEVNVEIFPKQGSVKRGGLGNLIKLPLGFHKRTGQRGLFVTPGGAPYPDQLNYLENIRPTNRRLIYAFIQRHDSKVKHATPYLSRELPGQLQTDDRTYSVEANNKSVKPAGSFERNQNFSGQVLSEEYDLERDRQFQFLIMKCPVIKAIVERINRESTISKEETLVLIHSVGHLERGPDAVNQLFMRCINADPSLFMKSKLKGNPVSCPKIRARVSHISSAVACNCRFDPEINLYPTPVIHVLSMDKNQENTPLGLTIESMQFQNLLQEYLKLRRQSREIGLLMKKYESQINQVFEQSGIEFLETPTGKLRQQKGVDNNITYTLEI